MITGISWGTWRRILVVMILILQCRYRGVTATSWATSSTTTTTSKPVLLLDVDNTLYDDRIYQIEQQIVRSIHQFVLDSFFSHKDDDDDDDVSNDSKAQQFSEILQSLVVVSSSSIEESQRMTNYQKAQRVSDYLHTQHGSTIHGLQQHAHSHLGRNHPTLPATSHHHFVDLLTRSFYERVYHPDRMDYSSLLWWPLGTPTTSRDHHHRPHSTTVNTGYGYVVGATTSDNTEYPHNNNRTTTTTFQASSSTVVVDHEHSLSTRQLLHSVANDYRIHLASNSPVRHVQSIVQAMGLCTLFPPTSTIIIMSNDDDDNANLQPVSTPDTTTRGARITDDDDDDEASPFHDQRRSHHPPHPYPTKLEPVEFFKVPFLTKKYENTSMVLIDDSNRICHTIQQSTVPMDTIHLDYRTNGIPSLFQAICRVTGWIPRRHPTPQYVPPTSTVDHVFPHASTSMYDPTASPQPPQVDDSTYQFNEVLYLQQKNIVDLQSIHRPTYHQMLNAVVASYEESQYSNHSCNNHTDRHRSNMTIVDAGAGVLFMLKILLSDDDDDENSNSNDDDGRLPSLLGRLRQRHQNAVSHSFPSVPPQHIEYYAYEPNEALYDAGQRQLVDLGFVLQTDTYVQPPTLTLFPNNLPSSIRVLIYQKSVVLSPPPSPSSSGSIPMTTTVTVHLCCCDFRNVPTIHQQSKIRLQSCSDMMQHATNDSTAVGLCTPIDCPNLIVGCCFADLFHDPNHLISSLLRCFGIPPIGRRTDNNGLKHTLLYFPITFTGTTSAYPAQPFETVSCEDGSQRRIPSDTLAFRYYAKALADAHHHNIDYHSIVASVENYGGITLGQGTSNWVIYPHINKYLWETMIYFFGTVAAPVIQHRGWYASGWIHRLDKEKPIVRANNVDLLFRIPFLGEWKFPQQQARKDWSDTATYDEISFTGPYEVTCIKKVPSVKLQPNEVRIQSEYSLISSGTELKIFQGKFDNDALLDTTIQDFNQEKMSYPLSYGYSLVGRVIECGTSVADAGLLLGRRVFTFSAHASQVTTDRSNVQIVPDDIDAIDAIFMPSVETALSLVHDAHRNVGENIAIFGQGLIGLLVTAVLNIQSDDNIVESSLGTFGTITTFDNIPDRLAASAQMGASQALVPTANTGPFDVVIEVSGNRLALQSAIDKTCHAGRLIVGSWYGCEEFSLKLGIDFHRSHISIKASQVSEIPAELSKTWTKARRFALTWALLKQIRPSRLISLRTTMNNAQEAYTALNNGTEIAIVFEF